VNLLNIFIFNHPSPDRFTLFSNILFGKIVKPISHTTLLVLQVRTTITIVFTYLCQLKFSVNFCYISRNICKYYNICFENRSLSVETAVDYKNKYISKEHRSLFLH